MNYNYNVCVMRPRESERVTYAHTYKLSPPLSLSLKTSYIPALTLPWAHVTAVKPSLQPCHWDCVQWKIRLTVNYRKCSGK